jgi:2-polyprenylphenol 6-hydroxylase
MSAPDLRQKSMEFKTDICVVGNGAIGKAAALGFAQAGLQVSLLTPPSAAVPPPGDAWDARVYALNPAARTLLADLKVWDALDHSRIGPVDAMIVRGDGGQNAGRLEFDAYGARADVLAWIVEDSNLNRALDAALKFAPNLRTIAGRAVQLQVQADAATIQLENGDVLRAALVVGADGGQSWVRAQCDIGLDYRSYHQRAIVANFSCEQPHHGAAFQWFTCAEGIIALLPLPGQRVSLVWSAPDQLADVLLKESAAQLAQRLSALPGHTLGQLHALLPESIKALPLALIRPHAITAPRVALAGDAAHVVHPLAGHGMNLGFADVSALIETVMRREPHRDCGDARVLGRYARARKEDILLMQLVTDGLERLFAVDFEPVCMARNIGLNLIDKLPGIKRALMSQAFGRSGGSNQRSGQEKS